MITGYSYPAVFPNFACSDLSDSDFTGSLLFGVYRNPPSAASGVDHNGPSTFTAAFPILYNANLANAKLSGIRIFTAIPVVPTFKSTNNLPMNQSLQPFDGVGLGSHSILEINWFKQPNLITVIAPGGNFRLKEPVQSDDWPSLSLALANLASARNLDKSDLSPAIKEFINKKRQYLSGSAIRTPCTPRG